MAEKPTPTPATTPPTSKAKPSAKRQKFLKSELEWVRAGVKARGTKQQSRLDAFYEIEGQEGPPEEREMDLLLPPAADLGNVVIELEQAGVNVGTEKLPRWLFRHLDLSIRPGTCTGIVGKNGVGKTTLLKLCLDQLQPTEGTAVLGKRVKINYIDQTRMQLDGTGSLLDEISDGNEKVQFGNETLGARAYLRRFLFNNERINERVDLLSGGERARLMLAKVLKTGGNLIVLDEPTNDLDLPSLRMLEEALSAFGGSILCVSHDRYFLDRICDQIIAFEEDGIHVTPGNYSYYLEKRQQREAAIKDQAKAYKALKPTAQKSTEKNRKLSQKERAELEGIEDKIFAAEDEVTTIEHRMNDPDFQISNYEQIPAEMEKLEAARAATAAHYERWEQLQAIADAE
jgi:ABC transport system ATP-binding/permease protein